MKNAKPQDEPRGDWRAMLAATPVPNAAAVVERLESDQVRLTIPRRRPWFLVPPISWIIRPSATRTVVLDTLGTQVWDLCDGQRPVEQIVEAFADEHQLTFHESRVAATNYLRLLIERGALAIAVPKQ
jgi:hypothetical protein